MKSIEVRKAIQRLLAVSDDGKIGAISLKAFRDLSQAPDNSEWPEVKPSGFISPPVPAGNVFDERTEKNLATLHPKAQPVFRDFMSRLVPHMLLKNVAVKIISGHRTYAEQDVLFNQRPKVTNARGGYSNHNFGVAVDLGLFKDGKYLDDSPLYQEAGPIGESVGLSWGGRWTGFRDYPHYEIKTGLTLAQMRERIANGESVL